MAGVVLKPDSRTLLAGAAGAFGSLDTALNVAFPDLVNDFELAIGDLQWVVVCYVLVYGGLLLAAGQLGDVWGHDRTLRIGAGISTVALVLCATAPTFELLLAARVLQGSGIALVMASAPAMLTTGLASEHTRAVGVFQTAAAVGLAAGPIAGGPLVEWLGWRGVFWFRVPLGVLLLVLTFSRTQRSTAVAQKVDRTGTLLVSIALGAAVLALNLGGTRGWTDPIVVAALVAAVASAQGFMWLSTRVEVPILDPALFRKPAFAAANVLAIVANGAMFATWLLVPALLIDRLDSSLLVAGLVLAASPACTAAASSLAGRRTGRLTGWGLSAIGLLVEGVGMIGLSRVNDTWSVAHVAFFLGLVGLGLGLFSVPNMAMVMGRLDASKQGVAGGLSLMTRTIGVVAGVAAASALFEQFEPRRGFIGAFSVVFGASSVVLWAAAAVAASFALGSSQEGR